jgi:hypothetical protein
VHTGISDGQPTKMAQETRAGHQHHGDQHQRKGRRPGGDGGLPADDQVRAGLVLADGFISNQKEAPDTARAPVSTHKARPTPSGCLLTLLPQPMCLTAARTSRCPRRAQPGESRMLDIRVSSFPGQQIRESQNHSRPKNNANDVSVPCPASNRSSNGNTPIKLITKWYTPVCINGYVLVRYTVDRSQSASILHSHTTPHHTTRGETAWKRE